MLTDDMIVEHDGKTYEFVRGSDVTNDGMFLEAWRREEPEELLLFAFWSDADGTFTFTAFQAKLPFSLVEQFIETARAGLPPPAEGRRDNG